MNKREAKREACWHAAFLIEDALEEGLSRLDRDEADRVRIAEALMELVAELERRSEPTTRRPPRAKQRQEFIELLAAAIQRRQETTP